MAKESTEASRELNNDNLDQECPILRNEKKANKRSLIHRRDEHLEEYCRRILKNGPVVLKDSEIEFKFCSHCFQGFPFRNLINELYFYQKMAEFDLVKALKFAISINGQKMKNLKILLKGKFTSVLVLEFFISLSINLKIQKIVFEDIFEDLEWLLKNGTYFIKGLVIDVFGRVFEARTNASEVSTILRVLEKNVLIDEFKGKELYKITDLRQEYKHRDLINCQFMREKHASFQIFVEKLFKLLVEYFKQFKPKHLTTAPLFFLLSIEYHNFNHLKRYEIYDKSNLFNQEISLADFNFDCITEELLEDLLYRAKANFSYFFFKILLKHLEEIWHQDSYRKGFVKKFEKKLRKRWLRDLEFSISSINSYISVDYEWLVSSVNKLDSMVWRMIKRDVEKSDYLLNWIMENRANISIEMKYLEFLDAFSLLKPSPSKCDRSLTVDLRLKKQQLTRTLKVLKKCYPGQILAKVNENINNYSPLTQVTNEKTYLRNSYKFLNFRHRKFLKKGEMIQISGTNIIFFTYINRVILVSLSIYQANSKICLRMEGTHIKKIFSSNYLSGELVDKLLINKTLVSFNFVLFQFEGYVSLYSVGFDSCNCLIKFSQKDLFTQMKFMHDCGLLVMYSPKTVAVFDTVKVRVSIVNKLFELELIGIEMLFSGQLVVNVSDGNQYVFDRDCSLVVGGDGEDGDFGLTRFGVGMGSGSGSGDDGSGGDGVSLVSFSFLGGGCGDAKKGGRKTSFFS